MTEKPPPTTTNGQQPVAELRSVRKTYYKADGTVLVEALAGIDLRARAP
jgi:hypothetical protein